MNIELKNAGFGVTFDPVGDGDCFFWAVAFQFIIICLNIFSQNICPKSNLLLWVLFSLLVRNSSKNKPYFMY